MAISSEEIIRDLRAENEKLRLQVENTTKALPGMEGIKKMMDDLTEKIKHVPAIDKIQQMAEKLGSLVPKKMETFGAYKLTLSEKGAVLIECPDANEAERYYNELKAAFEINA